MIVYWSACLISSFFTYFVRTRLKKKQIIALLFSGLPLFLLAAFRYGIGTDYHSYVNMYNLYFSNGIRGSVEPLFFQLNKLLAYMNFDVQWVFAICSFIITYGIFKFIFDNSPNAPFSVFLFVGLTYYMASFNTMRQFVALSICLLSIQYIKKDKFIPFCVCIFIAMGFHYSACCFLFVYWIKKCDIVPRLAIPASGIFLIVSPVIMKILIVVMQNSYYSNYLELNESSFNLNSIFGIVIQLCIFLFASLFYDPKDKAYKLFYNIQFVSLCLTMLGNYVPIIGRLKWYFGICTIVLIPIVITKVRNYRNKLFWSIIISISVFIYAEVVVSVLSSYGCLPYDSIL